MKATRRPRRAAPETCAGRNIVIAEAVARVTAGPPAEPSAVARGDALKRRQRGVKSIAAWESGAARAESSGAEAVASCG